MRPDLPSGTVTVLFTDVEGSTWLLHDLGAEADANALAAHRRVDELLSEGAALDWEQAVDYTLASID